MSRSYRKTAICGIAGNSDKTFKINWHKKIRRKLHQLLHKYEIDVLPIYKWNSWDSNKDGKTKFFNLHKNDPKYFKKLMRK